MGEFMIKTSILNMLFQKYLRFETGLLNTSNSSELPLRVIIFSKGHMNLTSLALIQGTEGLTALVHWNY